MPDHDSHYPGGLEAQALGELRRALYAYSMNSQKGRTTLKAKHALWLRLKTAARALGEAEGR